jgi:hypothetical protein
MPGALGAVALDAIRRTVHQSALARFFFARCGVRRATPLIDR